MRQPVCSPNLPAYDSAASKLRKKHYITACQIFDLTGGDEQTVEQLTSETALFVAKASGGEQGQGPKS